MFIGVNLGGVVVWGCLRFVGLWGGTVVVGECVGGEERRGVMGAELSVGETPGEPWG